jgi:hypothetical protein
MSQNGSDWTVQTADTIESVVGAIRDKTAAPLTKVARAIVFGVIVATVGLAALVLFVVGGIRLLVEVLPFDHSRSVWVAEAIVGSVFLLLGLFVWSKRKPKKH